MHICFKKQKKNLGTLKGFLKRNDHNTGKWTLSWSGRETESNGFLAEASPKLLIKKINDQFAEADFPICILKNLVWGETSKPLLTSEYLLRNKFKSSCFLALLLTLPLDYPFLLLFSCNFKEFWNEISFWILTQFKCMGLFKLECVLRCSDFLDNFS